MPLNGLRSSEKLRNFPRGCEESEEKNNNREKISSLTQTLDPLRSIQSPLGETISAQWNKLTVPCVSFGNFSILSKKFEVRKYCHDFLTPFKGPELKSLPHYWPS